MMVSAVSTAGGAGGGVVGGAGVLLPAGVGVAGTFAGTSAVVGGVVVDGLRSHSSQIRAPAAAATQIEATTRRAVLDSRASRASRACPGLAVMGSAGTAVIAGGRLASRLRMGSARCTCGPVSSGRVRGSGMWGGGGTMPGDEDCGGGGAASSNVRLAGDTASMRVREGAIAWAGGGGDASSSVRS